MKNSKQFVFGTTMDIDKHYRETYQQLLLDIVDAYTKPDNEKQINVKRNELRIHHFFCNMCNMRDMQAQHSAVEFLTRMLDILQLDAENDIHTNVFKREKNLLSLVNKRSEKASLIWHVSHWSTNQPTSDILKTNWTHDEWETFVHYKPKQLFFMDVDRTHMKDELLCLDANIENRWILCGVLLHHGNHLGGHYVIYLKQQNKWYLYDNAHQPVFLPEELPKDASKQCVLLLYVDFLKVDTH